MKSLLNLLLLSLFALLISCSDNDNPTTNETTVENITETTDILDADKSELGDTTETTEITEPKEDTLNETIVYPIQIPKNESDNEVINESDLRARLVGDWIASTYGFSKPGIEFTREFSNTIATILFFKTYFNDETEKFIETDSLFFGDYTINDSLIYIQSKLLEEDDDVYFKYFFSEDEDTLYIDWCNHSKRLSGNIGSIVGSWESEFGLDSKTITYYHSDFKSNRVVYEDGEIDYQDTLQYSISADTLTTVDFENNVIKTLFLFHDDNLVTYRGGFLQLTKVKSDDDLIYK